MHPGALAISRWESQNSKTSSSYGIGVRDDPGDACICGSSALSNPYPSEHHLSTEKEVFDSKNEVYLHYHPDQSNELQPSKSQASLQSIGSSARPDYILSSPQDKLFDLIHNDDAALCGHAATESITWPCLLVPNAEGKANNDLTAQPSPHAVEMDRSSMHSRKDSILSGTQLSGHERGFDEISISHLRKSVAPTTACDQPSRSGDDVQSTTRDTNELLEHNNRTKSFDGTTVTTNSETLMSISSEAPTRAAPHEQDENRLIPPPLTLTKTVAEIEEIVPPKIEEIVEWPDVKAGYEIGPDSRGSTSSTDSEPMPAKVVEVTHSRALMKSNSEADMAKVSRNDKHAWLADRGAARYGGRGRVPSAPPAIMARPPPSYAASSGKNRPERPSTFNEKSPALQTATAFPLSQPRTTVDENLQVNREALHEKVGNKKHAMYAESPDFVGHPHHRSFYGPGGIDETTPTALLDEERVKLIVHFWNSCDWDRAEKFLIGHLDSLEARSVDSAVRRIQHLLAVCSSFQGQWDTAIDRFIKVLRIPIKLMSDLDDGDCIAAYWLGDLFAMQNRRAEALLAYSMARSGTIFDQLGDAFRLQAQAERAAVQLCITKSDFKQHGSHDGQENPSSILNHDIVSSQAAKSCLAAYDSASSISEADRQQELSCLSQARPRSSYVRSSAQPTDFWDQDLMKITPSSFDPKASWPMPFDPLLSMANIERGRLYAYECDMLDVFTRNPDAKSQLPRPLGLHKLANCFTHQNLEWIITTLRALLRTHNIHHSEIVTTSGTRFRCRYPYTFHLPHDRGTITTTNYFSISLFRHALSRRGYGVDVVGMDEEGMHSARIVKSDAQWQNGVNVKEVRRIGELVRVGLEEAAMRQCGPEHGVVATRQQQQQQEGNDTSCGDVEKATV